MPTPTPKKTRKINRTPRTMYDKLESIENSITKLQSLIENRCAQIPAPELQMQGVQGVQEEQPLEVMSQGLLKKRPGPKLWNEFLKNYMRMQEAKGRKISRGQAMKEAGPNYRAKHDRPTPKTRKKVKNLDPVAPIPPIPPIPPMPPAAPMSANQPSVAPVARYTPTPPQVNSANVAKPITPGSLVTLAPGRGTPVNAPSAFQDILNTLTGTPRPNKKTTPVPTPVPQPPNQPNTSNTNLATPSNNETIPSPATYGYEDLGMAANNSARKVLISGEEYYMTDSDRALFQRMGDDLGEWVGYLEPGGVIHYTEQPNA